MNPSFRVVSCVAIGFLLVCVSNARAQEKTPKFELGMFYSALNVSEESDTDSGLGLRFTYNLNKYVGVEAETTDFEKICEDCVSNERQAFFGVRAGKRSKRYGVFAKVRPGYTRFFLLGTAPGPNFVDGGQARFSLDVGGVFEYYPHRHLSVRVDAGDTMIHYKTGDFFIHDIDQRSFVQRKLSHNLQINVGVAFRF